MPKTPDQQSQMPSGVELSPDFAKEVKRAERAERGREAMKSVSRGVDSLLESLSVGLGLAGEAKDKAVEVGGAVKDKAVETGHNLSALNLIGGLLVEQQARQLGRDFIANKHVRTAGRAAKYTGIAVAGAAALPFALAASPLAAMTAGPIFERVQPEAYNELRKNLSEKGKIGEYLAESPLNVPGKAAEDVTRVAKSAWEGITGWAGRQWTKVTALKDRAAAWGNRKLMEQVDKVGFAKKEDLKVLADQNEKLQKMLAEALGTKDMEDTEKKLNSMESLLN